jgi:DNA polymerase III alpha subunit
MVLLNRLGGMSFSNAYVFIKAVTERDWTTVDFHRKKFLADADKLEGGMAMDLINWLEDAAQYACCKADAIYEAIRIYQAAYLKVHHPSEFNQVVQAVGC